MWRVDEMSKIIPNKLRPLMPRPNSILSPSCSCRNPTSILQWTHHPISGMSDYGGGVRREAPLVSTRWNPTAEQLQALEEMYRRGIRTPSAEQIQQIAAKLRRFGKIEGKNVFYWFQNHKARERQKKRRQLEYSLNSPHTTKQTQGVSRRYIEIEHHKKLPTPTKCTSTPSESSVSMQGAAAVVIAKDDAGWTNTQIQLHHKILTAENEASSALSPNNSSLNTLTVHNPTVPDETTTLQLFPIHQSVREVETKFTPTHHFIEFLPTKN